MVAFRFFMVLAIAVGINFLGNIDFAVSKAMAAEFQSLEKWQAQADKWLAKGRQDKALAVYTEALEQYPANIELLLKRGKLCLNLGRSQVRPGKGLQTQRRRYRKNQYHYSQLNQSQRSFILHNEPPLRFAGTAAVPGPVLPNPPAESRAGPLLKTWKHNLLPESVHQILEEVPLLSSRNIL